LSMVDVQGSGKGTSTPASLATDHIGLQWGTCQRALTCLHWFEDTEHFLFIECSVSIL
jgi:hypothetical protein